MKQLSIFAIIIVLLLQVSSCVRDTVKQNAGSIPQDILSADALLYETQSQFDILGYLKPLNLSEEKKTFFEKMKQGARYNPQFRYSEVDVDFSSLVAKLDTLTIKDSPLSKMLGEKRDEIMTQINLLQSIGNDAKFSKFSIDLYGLPCDEAVDFAISYLSHYKREIKEETIYSAEHAVKYMQDALFEYKVDGWKVELTDGTSGKANVNNNKRTIQLNKDENFHESMLQRLRLHEIGVHVVRHEMGRISPLSILTLGLAGYLETEEGMAAYNEERNGSLSPDILATYCGRVIAVDTSQKNDFYTVYKQLFDIGFPENDAFTITFRVKRGLMDTGSHGGFTKDHVYLSGFLKVKEYVKSPEDFDELLKYGKIAIRHLATLRTVFGE